MNIEVGFSSFKFGVCRFGRYTEEGTYAIGLPESGWSVFLGFVRLSFIDKVPSIVEPFSFYFPRD